MNNFYIATIIILILLAVIAILVVELIESKENPPCQHKWDEIKTTDHYDISFGSRSFMYTTVRSRCIHCGKYKTFKLKG